MSDPARDVQQLLEECLDRYLDGESIESCAQRYPLYADEIREYLSVAERFEPVKGYEPSTEAKEQGRQRLLAEWEAIKREREQQKDYE